LRPGRKRAGGAHGFTVRRAHAQKRRDVRTLQLTPIAMRDLPPDQFAIFPAKRYIAIDVV
jgi:hypothetical protein